MVCILRLHAWKTCISCIFGAGLLMFVFFGNLSHAQTSFESSSLAAFSDKVKQILSDPRLAHLRASLAAERKLMQSGIHLDAKSGREYYTGYSDATATLYDWDSYFETLLQLYMGMGPDRSENAVLMFLDNQRPSGFIPRDIPSASEYPSEAEEHVKPFLAQIALLDTSVSGSSQWLDDDHFERIGRAIDYWLNQMDSNHDGLSEWMSGPHSGMDTQRERTGLWGARVSEGVDLNCYLVREMRAYASLAQLRGRRKLANEYAKKADQLRDRIRAMMWDESDGWYYDLNRTTGKPIRVKSVASFAVLWAGVATAEQAKSMVYEHLLNAREFWSNYPVPALARSEPGYSEGELAGDVGSGWRGNTWISANYMLFHGLRNYGYDQIARSLAYDSESMVKNAGNCEYYGSDSGKCMGLHPFWGWSLLACWIGFEDQSNTDLTKVGFISSREDTSGVWNPPPASYNQIEKTVSPGVRRPIAALATGQGNFFDSQSFDPCILVDPNDSTKLLMFFSGMAAPVSSGVITIGRATSTVADPTTWTVSNSGNPVLNVGGSGAWDHAYIRQDSCFYDSGTLYMFYTGDNGSMDQIGLATSSDNGLTWTKYSGNPILTPAGQGRNDGNNVSQGAVLKEGSNWTMIYAYRNGSAILPGYRYATSSNGTSWSKGDSGDILSCATARYCEFHQFVKIGSDYVLLYETGYTDKSWEIWAAKSSTATGNYTNSSRNPWLTKSGTVGAFDRYHVSTPFVIQLGSTLYLYESGAKDFDQPYTSNHWPLGVTSFTP
jgi:putative isomerase